MGENATGRDETETATEGSDSSSETWSRYQIFSWGMIIVAVVYTALVFDGDIHQIAILAVFVSASYTPWTMDPKNTDFYMWIDWIANSHRFDFSGASKMELQRYLAQQKQPNRLTKHDSSKGVVLSLGVSALTTLVAGGIATYKYATSGVVSWNGITFLLAVYGVNLAIFALHAMGERLDNKKIEMAESVLDQRN